MAPYHYSDTQNLSGDEIGISLYRLIIGSNNI